MKNGKWIPGSQGGYAWEVSSLTRLEVWKAAVGGASEDRCRGSGVD
ncbi:hypothetical protein SOVF_188410 [Spinacia oleracea]|nr:hypothetical protein SOVF_188410 [Spinacia oleracea]